MALLVDSGRGYGSLAREAADVREPAEVREPADVGGEGREQGEVRAVAPTLPEKPVPVVTRFGTDGLRGLANSQLTPEVAMGLGRAVARVVGRGHLGGPHERFIVGRDTRRSGPLLQAALSAGISAEGLDVTDVGVLSTPAVAYLAVERSAPAAVISASHNPFPDNGIKFFSAIGSKLPEELERALESELCALLAQRTVAGSPTGVGVGRIDRDVNAVKRYEQYLLSCLEGRDLRGLRVVLDCGNGAAFRTAPAVFRAAGARVAAVLGDEPDGTNINLGCGSTDPRLLSETVVAKAADLGVAFDGDADRVIAVDSAGKVVDGDRILALFATDLAARQRLVGSTVVVTVMTNLGFYRAMEASGIKVCTVDVGDRHVVEALDANAWALGGEQSGHIVFRSWATTGDGVLSGLLLADLVTRRGEPLAGLASAAMEHCPQVLHNVAVADKEGLESATAVWREVAELQTGFGPRGRILVRASGTEPIVRVMVEAPTRNEADWAALRIVSALEAALGSATRA